ncbi:hypothetical protein DXG01_002528 [Tephrocybe rancida]|nr:hypothetical protein DXG01_002528 [Tephrocybe rancida]
MAGPHLSWEFLAVLATWSIYLISLVACTVAYRISPFHPLANYPGPLVCKVSKLWFAYKAYGGRQHIYYNELHRRYGDIVRTGPNELSFCTPDVIAPMMGVGGMPKASYWDGRFAHQKGFRSLVGRRDPQAHARLRQVWGRGFTPDALRSYQPIINRRVDQLVDHLTRQCGKTVDMAKWISWFAYDIMNDIAFGNEIEMMQNQDIGGLRDVMQKIQPIFLVNGIMPWLPEIINKIPGVAEKTTRFRKFTLQRVLTRLKNGSASRDLFYHLADEGRLEATRPPVEQVASDVYLVIVGGSDTTSAALCNVFYHLMAHPVAYARLQAEIDESGLAANDFVGLAQLPYLSAVINETFRVLAPLFSGSMRSPLVGSGSHMLGSHYIPEGTTTNVHNYTMQRDARNFSPLPESFVPERWLPEERQLALEPEIFADRARIVHNTAAFLPFSHGPADCIGKKLAMQELRAVIFAVLKQFDVRFAPEYNSRRWEAELCDFYVIRKGELPVVLSLRLGKGVGSC